MPPRKAIFLDRDGVINVDTGYAHTPEQIQFIPGIFDFCRAAKERGYLLIVVTNQSGIGRGLFSEEQFQTLMEWMKVEFQKQRCALDDYYYCPHLPHANCSCRKPKPGMIFDAASEWEIDLAQSLLIGDKDRDIEAGRAAGLGKTILFKGLFPDF